MQMNLNKGTNMLKRIFLFVVVNILVLIRISAHFQTPIFGF